MDKELEKLIYSPYTTGKDINDYFYRIDKEELFLSIIKDYVIKEDKDEFPDSVFYFNPNGRVLFELKNSTLWCNYYLVWIVFHERYGMNYSEIQDFIKDMVEKHFKMKGVTPNGMFGSLKPWVEKHFKMKGVTPVVYVKDRKLLLDW